MAKARSEAELSEYARMALGAVERSPKGWVGYRPLCCAYGSLAARELLDSGLVRASGRGRNRKYHRAGAGRD